MKFKKDPHSEDTCRRIRIKDKWDDTVRVDTDPDGKTLWIRTENTSGRFGRHTDMGGPLVMVSRAKALKLAWAIIDELNPSMLA